MAAPQQGGGNQQDNSYSLLWIVAITFALLGILWYVLKDYIIKFFLTMKLYELDFLRSIASSLHFNLEKVDQIRNTLIYAQANPSNVSFNDLIQMGANVGQWLSIPLAIFLVALAVIVYVGNTTRMFKRSYSMKELAKLEQVNWPQISPVVNLDLINTDIDKGPWAMAMTPLQFCKRNKLLEEVRVERREGMSRKDWDRLNVVLKRGEANKLFALQLGQLWPGVDKLPPHIKTLFAAFAARINADTKGAEKLFRQLNLSESGKLNISGTDALLKKHLQTKPVQTIIQSHAYTLTVMASMLEGAREDGVQASADFLWLKPLDRKLWYTLNTVGRQTPFIEVAGIFAHWVAEKEAGRKLLVPMVEEATNAVEKALKEVVYRPYEA